MKIRFGQPRPLPWSLVLHAEGARSASTSAAVGPLPPSSHARRPFTGQCLWRLSRRLGAVRIFAAAGLTPARLGAVEPVGQCGAGARGTVDCCHERESQTHLGRAPTGGSERPCDRGATRPQLKTEHAVPGLTRPVFACSARPLGPGDSQASHRPKQQPARRRARCCCHAKGHRTGNVRGRSQFVHAVARDLTADAPACV